MCAAEFRTSGRDTEAKRYKHQAAEITEAHMQVNTEHCVLLPQEANILFHSMALSLSFHSVSTHTHVHTLLLCNVLGQ